MFPTSTPQFIHFKKNNCSGRVPGKLQEVGWSGTWLLSCSPCLLLQGDHQGRPGTCFSWEEACSDLMCLLNPSLLHRLWSHSSKPVAGVIPAVSLLSARKYLFQLFAEFRGHSLRRTLCRGPWCGSVRSSGDVFSHLWVSSPRAQMLIAVLLMCLKEKITF